MSETTKHVWRLDMGERVTQQYDWRPMLFWVGIFILVQVAKAIRVPWLTATLTVVFCVVGAAAATVIVMYLLGGKLRDKVTTKALPDIHVSYSVEVAIDKDLLTKVDYEGDNRLWMTRSKVRLDEIWGVKEVGKVIKVIKLPMYQTAFTFDSACFPTDQEKERFFSILAQHGAQIFRAQDPATELA